MSKPLEIIDAPDGSDKGFMIPDEPKAADLRVLLNGYREHAPPTAAKMVKAAMKLSRAEQRELLFHIGFALLNEASARDMQRQMQARFAVLAGFQGTKQ